MILNNFKYNIVIYGYGSHGKRIKSIIKKIYPENNFVNIIGIRRTPNENDDILLYQTLREIKNKFSVIHGVFITTPNDTHLDVFKDCLEYNIPYIYVEKPASKVEDYCLNNFELIKHNIKYLQIGYHMNYEEGFKELTEIIQNNTMGNLLKIDMFSGHGIAYKKNFQDSWRSKDKKSIIDTVLSHLINLILKINGDSNLTRDVAIVKKNKETGFYDNCHLAGVLNNGAFYSITASWGSPLRNIVRAYFSNGFWTYDYDISKITYEYPRDVFNEKGYFVAPKAQTKNISINGLENSIKYFLEKIKKNKDFPYEFNQSSLTAEISKEFLLIE